MSVTRSRLDQRSEYEYRVRWQRQSWSGPLVRRYVDKRRAEAYVERLLQPPVGEQDYIDWVALDRRRILAEPWETIEPARDES